MTTAGGLLTPYCAGTPSTLIRSMRSVRIFQDPSTRV